MNPHTETFYQNNLQYLNRVFCSKLRKIVISCACPKVGIDYLKYRRICRQTTDVEQRNAALGCFLDTFEATRIWTGYCVRKSRKADKRFDLLYKDQRVIVDHADPNRKDYYTVVTMVKNEARNMTEFVLFYQATGADRIYVYDNNSTDNLLEVLHPFISSGLVIYIKWPGEKAQTAGYRDAIRRVRGRARWLAIVDADEFIFSPKGNMKAQLRNYEAYPGVGVNWVDFGPNGHDVRPTGLAMDNYTTAILDRYNPLSCHIKSIVQPSNVACMYHTHFPIYKRGRLAVDEQMRPIGNASAFIYASGRAFTPAGSCEVFRMNHYVTRSYEDLQKKCARGYADGVANPQINQQLAMFDVPLQYDYTIKPYADIVRKQMDDNRE